MTTTLLDRLMVFPSHLEMFKIHKGKEKPEPYEIWFKPARDGEPFASFIFALTDTFDGNVKRVPVRVKMDASRLAKHVKTYHSYLKKEVQEEIDAGLEVTTLMEATRLLATYHEMVTFPLEEQEPMRCAYLHLVHYIMPSGIENPTPFALRVEVMQGGESGPCECWDIALSENDLDSFQDLITPVGES